MKRRKKFGLALAIVAIVTFGAAAAYAYFSTAGAGTATASTGTSSALVIHGGAATTLYPGTSSTVSFTVDNPSSGHQHVNTLHLGSVTTDVAHSACVVADYTMADVTVAQDVASGNGIAITATGTLSMANASVSQDACKGAPLTLNLTSN
jgi:hypothetical protein